MCCPVSRCVVTRVVKSCVRINPFRITLNSQNAVLLLLELELVTPIQHCLIYYLYHNEQPKN